MSRQGPAVTAAKYPQISSEGFWEPLRSSDVTMKVNPRNRGLQCSQCSSSRSEWRWEGGRNEVDGSPAIAITSTGIFARDLLRDPSGSPAKRGWLSPSARLDNVLEVSRPALCCR